MRIGYLAPLLFSLKDADRDLLRLLLMTSAARVQIRSDVDGSWSRPTSFLRDRRGFPVSSVDFFGPPSPTSGFGLRRSCELSYARVSQSGFYSAYVRRLRCEIYLTTQVLDTSLATCIRQSMYPTFLRARRRCPQEACAWEIRSCCTPRNFRRHCIRHLESGDSVA